MKKLVLVAVAIVSVLVLGAVLLVAFSDGGDSGSPNDVDPALAVANTFPAPAGANQAFPDAVARGIATKGWNTTGTVAEVCATWREAYRGWIDQGQAGSITGDEDARRCTLAGPKGSNRAELSVTDYGAGAPLSVVLTVRPVSP
jgi:hypothetical protein